MLSGKNLVVLGVAGKRSIAWAIAQEWAKHGANVGIGIQSSRFRSAVESLVSDWEIPARVVEVDVREESEISRAADIFVDNGPIDGLCHSIAYAPASAMSCDRLVDVKEEDFLLAHAISSYSLVSVTRSFLPVLRKEGSSVMALTYIGSQRPVPGYGVMGPCKASLEAVVRGLALDLGGEGVRVNALSAGPLQTLAGRGIRGFSELKEKSDAKTLIPGGIEHSDVGDMATFLASDLSSKVTGQTLYVDAGFNVSAGV